MQAEVTREWVTYRQAEEISGLSRTTLRKLAEALGVDPSELVKEGR